MVARGRLLLVSLEPGPTPGVNHPAPGATEGGVEADLTPRTLQSVSADLAQVRDRIRRDSAAGGYRPLPGQMGRIAALRRREQALMQELRRHEREGDDRT